MSTQKKRLILNLRIVAIYRPVVWYGTETKNGRDKKTNFYRKLNKITLEVAVVYF